MQDTYPAQPDTRSPAQLRADCAADILTPAERREALRNIAARRAVLTRELDTLAAIEAGHLDALKEGEA